MYLYSFKKKKKMLSVDLFSALIIYPCIFDFCNTHSAYSISTYTYTPRSVLMLHGRFQMPYIQNDVLTPTIITDASRQKKNDVIAVSYYYIRVYLLKRVLWMRLSCVNVGRNSFSV